MLPVLSKLFSVLIAALLVVFTARRWLFMWASGRAREEQTRLALAAPPLPSVLLLVPARDEAHALPACCAALAESAYPVDRWRVVFIDDGSVDDTSKVLAGWVAGRPGWAMLRLPRAVGKAAALNAALARHPEGEIVVVVDADDRLAPDALTELVRPFADLEVGATTGRRWVANPLASIPASYAALESLVHQEITLRAKDWLDLAPPSLGSNCAYRRSALAAVGGFAPGSLLEDSDATVRLARAGWRLRFVPAANSQHEAPTSLCGYWSQHTRWARGFGELSGRLARYPDVGAGRVTRRHTRRPDLRLELALFSAGYLDRVVLLAGFLLRPRSPRLLGGSIALTLITPWIQVWLALNRTDAAIVLRRRMFWLPIFFVLDVAMALAGLLQGTLRRPRVWRGRAMPA